MNLEASEVNAILSTEIAVQLRFFFFVRKDNLKVHWLMVDDVDVGS